MFQEHSLNALNIEHRKAMRQHGLQQIKNNSHCVQHNTGSKLTLIRKAISELQIRKERKEIKKVYISGDRSLFMISSIKVIF